MYTNNTNTNINPSKYKTVLCKHFDSEKGCSYKDNCQFAHGIEELKTSTNVLILYNNIILEFSRLKQL
jgi:hypothetical protein